MATVPYNPIPGVAPNQPLDYQRIQASPDAFGAGVGREVQQLGGEIGRGADVIMLHAQKMKVLTDETAAKQADIELTKRIDDIMFNVKTGYLNKNGGNAVTAYQPAHDAVELARNEILGGIKDPMVRRMVEGPAAHQTMTAMRTMSRHAATENNKYMLDTSIARSNTLIQSMGLNYTADPAQTIAALKSEAVARTELAGLGGADSDAAKVEIQKSVDSLQSARINGQRVNDPVGALATFQKVQSQLSPTLRYQLAEKIFTDAAPLLAAEIAREPKLVAVALNDSEALSLSEQASKMGKQFSITRRDEGVEAKTAFDGLPGDEKLKVMHLAHTMQQQDKSQIVQAVNYRAQDAGALLERGLPAPNAPTREELVATHGPVVGDRMQQSLDAARQFGDTVNRLATVPRSEQAAMAASVPVAGAGSAEALKRNEQLASAIQQVRKQQDENPADFVLANSLGVGMALAAAMNASRGNDPNATRRAYDAYASASIAEQNRLGMPVQGLLPKPLADSIIAQFTDFPGNQNTVKEVKTLADQWGRHWPQVYGELAKSLPDTPLVIGSGMKEGPAMLLAGLTQEKMGEITKGLPKTTDTDIKEQLDKQFEPGRMSLIASNPVSGLRTFNSFYGASNKLATLYVSQGKSPKDAAQQAYADTFGDKYEFLKSGPAYLRVPKSQDLGQVSTGLGIAKGGAEKFDLMPLRSLAGLDESQRMAATVAQVKADGYWVTSPDESGATLYLDGAPVLKKDGGLVYQSWYALATAGRGVPAQPDLSPKVSVQPAFYETPGGAVTGVRRKK